MRAQLIELVTGVLGRIPTPEELANWTSSLEDGGSLSDVIQELMYEFGGLARIVAPTNEEMLINAYQNLFGRLPDNDGLEYWLYEMSAGRVNRDNLIPSLIAGAFGEEGNPNDALLLNARVQTALNYLDGLDNDNDFNPQEAATTFQAVTRSSVAEPSDEPAEDDLYTPGEVAKLIAYDITGDNVINIAEAAAGFGVYGTGEPGATVEISLDGQLAGEVAIDEKGLWHFMVQAGFVQQNGTFEYTAVQRNDSGDIIGSVTKTITVDLDAPADFTGAPVLADDTGDSTNDGITNNGAVTVDTTGIEADATWQYSDDAGATWNDGTGNEFTLAEGEYADGDILVRQVDAAGNPSQNPIKLAGVVKVDATVSDLTLTLNTDTGANTSDGITNNPTMDVGDIDTDVASWEYSLDGGANWTAHTGNTSFDLTEGTYAAGDIQVRQTDEAGNVSTVTSNTSAIEYDATNPAAPSVALNADTGDDNADGITNNATIDVTDIEADATWEYSTDGGNSWAAGTGSSFDLTEGTYAGGDIQVRQTDEAGNTSAVGQNGGAITYDATPPALNGAVVVNDGGDGLDNGETIVFTFDDAITSFGTVGGAITLSGGGVLSAGDTVLTFTSDGGTTTGNITLMGVVDVAGNTADFDETIA